MSNFAYTSEGAPLFEKALPICFNEKDAEIIMYRIEDKLGKHDNLRLLDIGVGTGQVFIPLYKKLTNQTTDCTAFVVDNNANMLKCFRENCMNQGIDLGAIKILQKNFKELTTNDCYYFGKEDIILMTRVLHQLREWQIFLKDLLPKLNSGGVIIFTESFGDLYEALNFVKPTRNSQKAISLFQNINYVFGGKHRKFIMGKAETKISAIHMKPVRDFFESKGFTIEKLMEIRWEDNKNSWNDYLKFIRKRVFTPIFLPFTKKEPEYETKIQLLDKKMQETFREHNWELDRPVNEKLGVSFYCCFRG